MSRIGFVGTGSMGGAVAATLLSAGHELNVHDRRPAASAALVAAGAGWRDSPAAVADGAEVVLLSLPSDVEVEQVCLGPLGVLAALEPGRHLIDLSTVSAALVPRLCATTRHRGVRYLAAPVSQGVDNARLGRLSVFAGGSNADLEQCLPILRCFATTVIHTGDQRSAVAAKLLTNLLWYVNAAAIGEALAIGAKSGLDLTTLKEVILNSCGTSWVAEHDIPSVYSGDFDPTFTTALCVKDLRLIRELADALAVPLMMAEAATAAFERAHRLYGGHSPELSVVRHVQEAAGVELQTSTLNR